MKKILFVVFAVFISSVSSAQTWVKVSCGAQFSVGLRSNGELWAWGFNGDGQLGIGDNLGVNIERDSPVRIGTDSNWKDIEAGGTHCVALKKDGSLWTWGSNYNGELGDGTTANKLSPIRIGSDTDWDKIEANWINSFAIKKDHSLYGWGNNYYNQIGDGTAITRKQPIRIGTDTDWIQITAGGEHILARKSNKTLWSWGHNASGQVGIGSKLEEFISQPRQIGTDTNWTDISAGYQFSAAVRSDNTLWTWGYNGNSQLGYLVDTSVLAPRMVPGDSWMNPEAGPAYCLAQKLDGTLWGWGHNVDAQLGIDPQPIITTPTQVGGSADWKLIAPASGVSDGTNVYGSHTMAIRGSGINLCGAGANNAGQLGTGTPTGIIILFRCDVAMLSIDEQKIAEEQVEMSIFPNPTIETVTITLPHARNAKVEVFDVLGNTLFTAAEVGFDWHWDLHGYSGAKLSAGSYIIRATGVTNEGKRFVVSRMVVVN